MEVWGKNPGIFVDGPVLYNMACLALDLHNPFETLFEKIDLQVE
ncbi:hypothetical protein SDC9_109871 [bioreactor metagenome]|uniref:Uncharacterized protein n=1 Tax=bioreactor metagenome TaxID=1076179 RepID=A0A645BIG9_9ZZZZ